MSGEFPGCGAAERQAEAVLDRPFWQWRRRQPDECGRGYVLAAGDGCIAVYVRLLCSRASVNRTPALDLPAGDPKATDADSRGRARTQIVSIWYA